MKESTVGFIGGVISIPITAILIAGFCVYEAACTVPLWKWFVSEPFGIRELNYPLAIGLNLVVGIFTHQMIPTPKEEKDKNQRIISSLLKPVLCLFIGWIVKTYFL